jgi:Carbohydrate binding module (family 35)/Carbohydrate binding module (family 6)
LSLRSAAVWFTFGALALFPSRAAFAATCAVDAVCEAESAVLGGGAVARGSYPGYTGTGFVQYAGNGTGSVEWTVDVPTAGTYSLSFRYAHGGTADRPLSIRVNGAVLNPALSFPITSWTGWTVTTQTASLPAGVVRIRASEVANGPNLDSLTVTGGAPPPATGAPRAVPSAARPPIGCAVGDTCEAETALLGPEVVAATLHTGYTGSGFADYPGSGNGFVEWTVIVPTAGTYSLSFRYANGGGADRPMSIRVNGTVVNTSMSFPVTTDWKTWAVRSQTATLPAGVVRIRATESPNGSNIDNLTVTAGAAPILAGGARDVWVPRVNYAVGTLATYGGASYRCIKAHTSQIGWEPPNTTSLWALAP